MIERDALNHLNDWIKKPHRKPLVVRGARQVGKSTLIRQFAKRYGLTLFEVNLERHPRMVECFASLDPGRILREVEYLVGKGAIPRTGALLFLDEIQGVPQALQSLRYFYEEMPDLPVVAAGSLLEFTLAEHAFPMPVGRVEYFHLGPLTWEEFLGAVGAHDLLELLRGYALSEPFPGMAHGRLVEWLRRFLLVGGMPEAVQIHADGSDLRAVFEVQESIVQTYRDDFSKYAHGADLARLHRIFDYAGRHLGEKVKYSTIDRDSQSRELRKALDLILKAGVLFRVNHAHGDGIPLQAQQDDRVFKLFHLDLSFHNRAIGLSALREGELAERRFVNEGKLAEQFIAQSLYFSEGPTRPPALHYWLRQGRATNAEVDFLAVVGDHVLPVEVKAGKAGTLKSLVEFARLKASPAACRFDMNPPSLVPLSHRIGDDTIAFDLISLPLYMVNQMHRLMASRLQNLR